MFEHSLESPFYECHQPQYYDHHYTSLPLFYECFRSEYAYKKKEQKTDLIINYSNFNYFYYLIISLNTRTNDRPKFNYCFILFCFKSLVLKKITVRQKGGFSHDTAVISTTFTQRQFFIIFKSDD